MARPASTRPTEVELQILRILWDLGPSPVREIHKRLEADKGTNYSTTVKMLAVMLDKGLVKRDERAQHSWEHQADGVPLAPDWTELIEVELTAKRPGRYQGIFRAFRGRAARHPRPRQRGGRVPVLGQGPGAGELPRPAADRLLPGRHL